MSAANEKWTDTFTRRGTGSADCWWYWTHKEAKRYAREKTKEAGYLEDQVHVEQVWARKTAILGRQQRKKAQFEIPTRKNTKIYGRELSGYIILDMCLIRSFHVQLIAKRRSCLHHTIINAITIEDGSKLAAIPFYQRNIKENLY